jgi:hypothetical protein
MRHSLIRSHRPVNRQSCMPGDHRSCRSELKKCSPIHEYLRDLYYLILSGTREAFRALHSTRLVVFVPGGRGTHDHNARRWIAHHSVIRRKCSASRSVWSCPAIRLPALLNFTATYWGRRTLAGLTIPHLDYGSSRVPASPVLILPKDSERTGLDYSFVRAFRDSAVNPVQCLSAPRETRRGDRGLCFPATTICTPVEHLTNNPADEAEPSWSRDGNWLYCGSNRTGFLEIHRVPANGGSLVQITRAAGCTLRNLQMANRCIFRRIPIDQHRSGRCPGTG